jgi:predicted CopG family antitoxin
MCLNLFLNMAKTITISEEAYKLLLNEKRVGESFSDVIIRLIKSNKKNIMDYAGIWADISDEEVSKLFKDLEKMWERWNVDV